MSTHEWISRRAKPCRFCGEVVAHVPNSRGKYVCLEAEPSLDGQYLITGDGLAALARPGDERQRFRCHSPKHADVLNGSPQFEDAVTRLLWIGAGRPPIGGLVHRS